MRAKGKAGRRPPMIAGVDEAGRGPVIGPMVVCGVAIAIEHEKKIAKMGVKDSKLLTPKKRRRLAEEIKGVCEYEIIVVEPGHIDSRIPHEETLNALEAECFSDIIRTLKPKIAYVDACDVNAERFGLNIKKSLGFDAEVVSRHYADRDYPIVSAASILAKVHRDYLVEQISESVGANVGSGYPHDPVTIEFLKRYYRKNKRMPAFVRMSWKTTADIINDYLQSRLTQFL